MKRHIQLFLATFMTAFCLTVLPAAAAVADTAQNDVCTSIGGTNSGGSCTTPNNVSSISDIIKIILNVLSYITGIVAVIMVVVGGFQYITSNGDSGKTTSARHTITYALVGIAVAALAQILVQFVLHKVGT